jgi:hypothetical protein
MTTTTVRNGTKSDSALLARATSAATTSTNTEEQGFSMKDNETKTGSKRVRRAGEDWTPSSPLSLSTPASTLLCPLPLQLSERLRWFLDLDLDL